MIHDWLYPCSLLRAVDGDTVDLAVDLGWQISLRVRVRLAGIDTAELNSRDPELRILAKVARDQVTEWCGRQQALRLHSHDLDKYGRSLGDLHGDDDQTLTDFLLERHLAVIYDGGDRSVLEAAHRANVEWRQTHS